MRIVIAPDKFKGSLSAAGVAQAIAAGVRAVIADASLELCPLADGGEGTVEALVAATGGRLMQKEVCGPLPGMRVRAEYGILGDGRTAVIEMAAASGLALLTAEQRDPSRTTTYGTGELILAAGAAGVEKIILGIGGSATTDGGLGALQALGARIELVDAAPATVPLTGGDLARVASAKPPSDGRLPQLLVACDVTNPLCGPSGAARVYGPQKGATPAMVQHLDEALASFARVLGAGKLALEPGSGAAGGLGFGLRALFPQTTFAPGFDLVAGACRLEARLAGADLCLTGEGRLDESSLAGKTAIGVARLCRSKGIPCVILAGSIAPDVEPGVWQQGAAAMPIAHSPMPLEQAMREASSLLTDAAARVMRLRA